MGSMACLTVLELYESNGSAEVMLLDENTPEKDVDFPLLHTLVCTNVSKMTLLAIAKLRLLALINMRVVVDLTKR